jgi:hypothetical protein
LDGIKIKLKKERKEKPPQNVARKPSEDKTT